MELDLLADIVFQLQGGRRRVTKFIEVKIDLRFWECDEAVGRTQEVPAVIVDLLIVDRLRYRVVLDAVLDRLDGVDTHRNDDDDRDENAKDAVETATLLPSHSHFIF